MALGQVKYNTINSQHLFLLQALCQKVLEVNWKNPFDYVFSMKNAL